MNDDDTSSYLWDGTGTPDPEVAHLEGLLRPYRHAAEPPLLVLPPPRSRALRLFTVAAAVAAVAVVGTLVSTRAPPVGFDVTTTGIVWIAGSLADTGVRLEVGQHLTTGLGGAKVQVADIGELTVAPHSDLQLVKTSADLHLLSLQRGRIEAVVDAPPRLLVVKTPSLTAVDLGCVYSLDVTAEGKGRLEVESGWVELEGGPSRTFVVAGMAADFDSTGPSIPTRDEVSPAFSRAVTTLDVGAILTHATADDDVTLWHVFSRVTPPDRLRILETLSTRTPIASDVRARLVSGDLVELHRLLDRIAMRPITTAG